MNVPVILLPSSQVAPRDLAYCSVAEAQIVCASLQASPGFPSLQSSGMKIVQVDQNEIGGAPNTNNDGRLALEIQFLMDLTVTNSSNRQQLIPVPFKIIAGILLKFIEDGNTFPWKFQAEPGDTPDTWFGNVSK